MGAKSLEFFLLLASAAASSVRWRPRSAPGRGVRASGSSSPTPPAAARGGWGDSAPRSGAGSVRPPAAWSTSRCGSRRPVGLGSTAVRAAFSGPEITLPADRGRVSGPSPTPRSAGRPTASASPNSPRSRLGGPLPSRFPRLARAGWLGGAVSLTVWVIRGVSYPRRYPSRGIGQYSMCPFVSRKSNKWFSISNDPASKANPRKGGATGRLISF